MWVEGVGVRSKVWVCRSGCECVHGSVGLFSGGESEVEGRAVVKDAVCGRG